MNADSIHFPDSLKYKTLVNQRIVYGGGGIMPDYFVPMDTTEYTDYSGRVNAMGLTYRLALNQVDANRKGLLKKYPTIDKFKKEYVVSNDLLDDLVKMATESKIEFKEDQFDRSKDLLKRRIKSSMARDLYDMSSYFQLINDESVIFTKGLEIIRDDAQYYKLLKQK